MSALMSARKSTSMRTWSIVAVATILLTVACGTGAAAFAGLLPSSKGVAVAVTAIPLIDVQFETAARADHHRSVNLQGRALLHA